MDTMTRPEQHDKWPGLRQWVAAAAFLAIALYLVLQYQAHVFALLPFGLALASLGAHLVGHRRKRRA